MIINQSKGESSFYSFTRVSRTIASNSAPIQGGSFVTNVDADTVANYTVCSLTPIAGIACYSGNPGDRISIYLADSTVY